MLISGTKGRFLREREVKAKTSLSRPQRWRLESRGEFPLRVRLGPRTVGWWEGEIEDWMKSRPRARYVPKGAVLGPRSHSDDEDKPSAT
jgi:prophage regulatory protein